MTSSAPGFPSRRRSAEVLHSHLQLCRDGDVDADISVNYDHTVVLIKDRRAYRGHRAVRELAQQLCRELPHARFKYHSLVVAGEVALLEWTAFSPRGMVRDGVDSFWIRNGLIVAQTIHYTVLPFRKPKATHTARHARDAVAPQRRGRAFAGRVLRTA